MNKTVKVSIPALAYRRLESSIKGVIEDSPYSPEIYENVIVSDNGTHEFNVLVVIDDPYSRDTPKAKAHRLTLKDLVSAYLSLGENDAVHCGGCHILYDPDACSGDRILQQAIFGEQIYG